MSNSKKILIASVLLLACMLSGALGGFIALNMLPFSESFRNTGNYPNKSYDDTSQDIAWLDIINQSMIDISASISPSIVGIVNKIEVDSRGDDEKTELEQGTGSGIIIDSKGYILTNNHVIEGADAVTVILSSGKEVKAVVVGMDSRGDLAVLKIEEPDLIAAQLGDSSKLKSGELAFAIGNPLGLNLSGSITMGIISGTDRTLTVEGKRLKLIQTDAAINPGNSGGALVNSKGQVVGINTLKEFYAGSVAGIPIGVEGVGFAIPINEAMPIVEELIEKGFITRPGLGVTISAIPKNLAEIEGIPQGLYVNSVVEKGSADKAGVLVGDIIIGFQDKEVKAFQELVDHINEYSIGDTVQITVWREGKEIELTVELAQLPE